MKKIIDFSQQLKSREKGFTLIELLVVIGILAILLAIVLVAVNPGQQFDQANDTQRQADVNTILNGVSQYMVDNNGDLPTATETGTAISSTSTAIGGNTGEVDLCTPLVPDYVADMPADPTGGSDYTNCQDDATYETGYEISETDGRVTVTATGSDGSTISATR